MVIFGGVCADEEQRRLYHAAKIIQHFYRRYKDKKEQQQRQRQRQMEAAILIQSYYRRYKQVTHTQPANLTSPSWNRSTTLQVKQVEMLRILGQ